MWGIQLVSTIFERILLFVICAVAIAATLVLNRWVRSPKLRPFVPLIGALALFRGLYAFSRVLATVISLCFLYSSWQSSICRS
jgi:hypothetical protein